MVKPHRNEDPQCQVHATAWAKGSVINHEQEPHHQCGSLAAKIWLSGIVNCDFVQKSKTKHKMHYIGAAQCLGVDKMKTKTAVMLQLHLKPPTNMSHAQQGLTSFISAGGKLTAALDSDDNTVDPTAGSAKAAIVSNTVPRLHN